MPNDCCESITENTVKVLFNESSDLVAIGKENVAVPFTVAMACSMLYTHDTIRIQGVRDTIIVCIEQN